ncbi:MAG: DNA adenine methylase [DPANN group archaeon]|nr:DNA adenine methylase [DPANN group archaeon]
MVKPTDKIEIPKFIKWAGGKTQLIEQFIPLFPKKIERYFEPFLGSGAVFFYIIEKYKPKEILLSDINKELINAYIIVKTDVERLIIELKQHKEYYKADSKKYYYEIRSVDPTLLPSLEQAARFIFLNKTCFNGLYRVNSKGKFNVPIGAYKNPDIIQEDKLRKVSKILQTVQIKVMSFEKIIKLAKKDDFIYFDPPYDPLKKGTSFTTYSKGNFLDPEQKQLCDVFQKLDKKGCKVMESNNDTEFIRGLYDKYDKVHVSAKRMINCNATKRGNINELVIRNYKV